MTLERIIEILRNRAECIENMDIKKNCTDCPVCEVCSNPHKLGVAHLFAADKLEAVLQRENKFGSTEKGVAVENDTEASLGNSQGLYLSKAEVDALKEEVDFMYEIMDSNEEGLARQGAQLAAILNYIFITKTKNEN